MTQDFFAGQKYINIESYRRDGSPVRTPVWFAQDGETLYVWTQNNSGKVKRIRREQRVRIAPCQADGTPVGDWLETRAEIDASPETLRHVQAILRRKYGLAFAFFRWMGREHQYTSLKILPRG